MSGGLGGMIRSSYYDNINNLKPIFNSFPADNNMHIQMILYILNDYPKECFQHKHYVYCLQDIFKYM